MNVDGSENGEDKDPILAYEEEKRVVENASGSALAQCGHVAALLKNKMSVVSVTCLGSLIKIREQCIRVNGCGHVLFDQIWISILDGNPNLNSVNKRIEKQ